MSAWQGGPGQQINVPPWGQSWLGEGLALTLRVLHQRWSSRQETEETVAIWLSYWMHSLSCATHPCDWLNVFNLQTFMEISHLCHISINLWCDCPVTYSRGLACAQDQLCPTLWYSMDCSPPPSPGSSLHEISQANPCKCILMCKNLWLRFHSQLLPWWSTS